MWKNVKKCAVLLWLGAAFLPLPAQEVQSGAEWTKLPPVGAVADTAYRKGVSAAYAGLLGGRLVVAGGCNFPGVPAAEGGAKVYYDDVFTLRTDALAEGWTRADALPEASAYGVALPTDSGLALIGGTSACGPLAATWELRLSERSGDVVYKSLSPLSQPVDNMAGARLGRRLYVVGGNVDGAPSNRVFSLSLDSLSAGWREEPPFPGEPRVQPVCVALRRGDVMYHQADGQPQKAVYLAHPFAVAAGQVVVDGDDVDALAGQRVQIGGQGGHQGLAFAGLHLGDAALVQDDAADELHPVGPHAQHAPGGLPGGGEGLGQDVVQRLAVLETLLEFRGLGLQLGVGQSLVLLLQRLDFIRNGIDGLQLPLGVSAEEFR